MLGWDAHPSMTKPSREFQPAPFFVMRSPLLPFEEWLALGDGLQSARAGEAQLEAALLADREALRRRLRAIVERPEIREALFVASPSLDEAIPSWLDDPTSDRGIKAERTIVRYVARMCGRSTPFGIFAGCSVGEVGDVTQLRLRSRDHARRHTRLDMDYLFALCEVLARDPELRTRLHYRTNSSLYRAGGRLRYAEAHLEGKDRSYALVDVEPSDALDAVLASAREGARAEELAARLAEHAEVSLEEAREFIGELIDSQMLVSELQPPVTGPEPLGPLLRTLEGHAAAPVLAGVGAELAAMDDEPLGIPPGRYRKLAERLGELPTPVELSRLFQVDLVKPADALRLGKDVLAEIDAGMSILARLARPKDFFREFREAFVTRYEAAEVPLAQVLDEESGIGFETWETPATAASPLLAGLVFPTRPKDEQATFTARERLLLAKVQAAARTGAREIELAADDIDALATREPLPLPDSLAMRARILAESEAAIASGRFRVLVSGGGGPPGARIIGRFLHGDPRLSELVREYVAAEEGLRPEVIFAEIVHLPDGRMGNTLLRPVLRGWELPYLGVSGAPVERQIPLDDLFVTVQGSRVVLRSRKLSREIVPRLTTAHAYRNPLYLGIYRFLCALQSQGLTTSLSWSWGALDAFPFLPRLVCGRVVLTTARWRLDGKRLRALGRLRGTAQYRAVQELRRELELPRHVAVEDDDNTLPIDLDSALSVETFVHMVKDREHATLIELLAGPEDLAASAPEGRFVHEIVVPYLRVRRVAAKVAKPPSEGPSLPRRLLPGSDWLYAKLYTGLAMMDDLLRDHVAPLVRATGESGAHARWFFVREADPDWHLRLRFQGEPERLHDEVEPALREMAASLLAAEHIFRFQLDTYHREIERYSGSEGMVLCERLFHADSEAVLAILELLDADAGADARWRLALCGIHRLLGDLGFDLDSKRAVLGDMRRRFGREFNVDAAFEKQLGERFRRERAALEALVAPEFDETHPLAPGLEILTRRSEQQRATCAELLAAHEAGRLSKPVEELLPSLAHMHANRILRSGARAQELVLYDFLLRLYDSQAARKNKSASPGR